MSDPGSGDTVPARELERRYREQAAAYAPLTQGDLSVGGLDGRVEIRRDRWGVPHVSATSIHDAFFAQGWLMAADRLFQIDRFVRLAAGRIATLLGEDAVPQDRWMRQLGRHRLAPVITSQLNDRSAEVLGAWADGIQAFVDRMPVAPVEYELLGARPEFPTGPGRLGELAAMWVAFGEGAYWGPSLLRTCLAERIGVEAMRRLLPGSPTEAASVVAGRLGGAAAPSALDLLRRLGDLPDAPLRTGSNNWAVAGSRTASGLPIVANDSHQGHQTPSGWFEIHLSAPGLELSGVTIAFTPGVIIGHSDRVAWAFTDVIGAPHDLYLERLDASGTHAWYEDRWEPLAVRTETIEVLGRSEPERFEVRETRHGPLLDRPHPDIAALHGEREVYALRWAADGTWFEHATLLDMAQARDVHAFREALRGWNLLGENCVFGDVEGNIAYQLCGTFPRRRKGDGSLPVPGWTGAHEWDGTIAFEELPHAVNPASGYLVTANQRTYDDTYPYVIGRDHAHPARARRIAQRITERPVHDVTSIQAIQADRVSLVARELLPFLRAIEPSDELGRWAVERLRAWDGAMEADAPEPALYHVWLDRFSRTLLEELLGEDLYRHWYAGRRHHVLADLLAHPIGPWFDPEGPATRDALLLEALDAALAQLTRTLGDDHTAWRWGELHRVTFRHGLADRVEEGDERESLLVAGRREIGGDTDTVYRASWGAERFDVVSVATWRQVIDLADLDASVGTHTTGASSNPASAHWNDLVDRWVAVDGHPLPLSDAAVAAVTEETLTLHPT